MRRQALRWPRRRCPRAGSISEHREGRGSPHARPSRLWLWAYRALYRLLRLVDPLLRVGWRAGFPSFSRTVEVRVAGRRSGRERRTLVTLLTVDGVPYLGHPNGPAPWTRNVEAAPAVEVVDAAGRAEAFQAVALGDGPEREAVIRATWTQQPFPGNVIYAAARRHVRAVGVYFRLVPVGQPDSGLTEEAAVRSAR